MYGPWCARGRLESTQSGLVLSRVSRLDDEIILEEITTGLTQVEPRHTGYPFRLVPSFLCVWHIDGTAVQVGARARAHDAAQPSRGLALPLPSNPARTQRPVI